MKRYINIWSAKINSPGIYVGEYAQKHTGPLGYITGVGLKVDYPAHFVPRPKGPGLLKK